MTNILISKKINNGLISYIVNLKKLEYTYEDNNLRYNYIYNLETNILDVSIKDGSSTEIENYQYDYKQNKVIECHVGKCNNYKDIMILIKKNFLDLLAKQ